MIHVLAVPEKNSKNAMGNKVINLRFRKKDRDIFENIRNGNKVVETRAATARFKNIESGDAVVFVCGRDKFVKKVKNVRIFKSIPAMLKRYKAEQISPQAKSKEELEKMYYSFPNYREKIKKFGLVAFDF